MSETRDGNIARRLLVVGAHSGDFVWRSAGAIAVATSGGGEVRYAEAFQRAIPQVVRSL